MVGAFFLKFDISHYPDHLCAFAFFYVSITVGESREIFVANSYFTKPISNIDIPIGWRQEGRGEAQIWGFQQEGGAEGEEEIEGQGRQQTQGLCPQPGCWEDHWGNERPRRALLPHQVEGWVLSVTHLCNIAFFSQVLTRQTWCLPRRPMWKSPRSLSSFMKRGSTGEFCYDVSACSLYFPFSGTTPRMVMIKLSVGRLLKAVSNWRNLNVVPYSFVIWYFSATYKKQCSGTLFRSLCYHISRL